MALGMPFPTGVGSNGWYASRSRILALLDSSPWPGCSRPSRLASCSARRLRPRRVDCGVERWTVKTLGDRPSLRPAKAASIKSLTALAAPEGLPQTRLPLERRLYRVTAAVTLVRPEDDGDFHLVLQDGSGRTMIAESPLGSCGRSATAHRQRQIAAARERVRLCPKATVTGVAFFDFQHGQTGVAPNGIELHPILAFSCSSGVVVSGSPAPKPPSAAPPGKVKLVSVTSPISAGSDATLVVQAPSGATARSSSPTSPGRRLRRACTRKACTRAKSRGRGWSERARLRAGGRSTSPAARRGRSTRRSTSRSPLGKAVLFAADGR